MTTFAYCIVRAELTGGSLPMYCFHAGRECPGLPPSKDERGVVLVATKAQVDEVVRGLQQHGIAYQLFDETDGQLAGSNPVLTFACLFEAKDALCEKIPLLKKLRPWSAKAAAEAKAFGQRVTLKLGDKARMTFGSTKAEELYVMTGFRAKIVENGVGRGDPRDVTLMGKIELRLNARNVFETMLEHFLDGGVRMRILISSRDDLEIISKPWDDTAGGELQFSVEYEPMDRQSAAA